MKDLNKIIAWLKINGEMAMGGKNYSVEFTDEPYMKFAAEWQDWNGEFEKLFIGYYFVQNGDLCCDPEYVFTINSTEVSVIFSNDLAAVSMPIVAKSDMKVARLFAETVYERHMLPRVAEVAK